MSAETVKLIQSLYDAFAVGDVPTVLGAMTPDIVWMEAENFPYADHNPYVGPQAILDGVFMRLATEWDGFHIKVGELLDAGDTVVMLGRYGGTCKATGRVMDVQAVHVFRVAGGKVTAFQQYVDTAAVAAVVR